MRLPKLLPEQLRRASEEERASALSHYPQWHKVRRTLQRRVFERLDNITGIGVASLAITILGKRKNGEAWTAEAFWNSSPQGELAHVYDTFEEFKGWLFNENYLMTERRALAIADALDAEDKRNPLKHKRGRK